MSTRQNDWAAVLLNISNSENIDLGEDPMKTLYGNGITPDNTELKDEDYYKSIPQVINGFTKDGEFDEKSYKQFYDSALRSYTEFSETPFLENMLDDIGVTSYDSSRLYNPAKVKDLSAVIMPWHDRNRSTYGTANIWEKGSKTFSDREVAQANFVRDENGNKLEWTPNDKAGLFSGLFAPALVYATYTEDVFDEDGKLIHQKGETKLDENGDPYTELLGDRPAYGQDLVKWTDIMTVDGSWWNKYVDVFDSDSLEKSMGKTIAKTALMLTPYFTPLGSAMGWINATIGLTTALPSLVKSLDGLLLGGSDSALMDSMTKLENIMGRFKPSVSDEARGRFFSMENIGDLLVSSSGQLFSQRNIANSLYKLQPFSNQKTNQKFAELMSTGYMALTSVSDVYGEMKAAGANDRIAGLGSLLSLGGFFTLLQNGYFKNKLFEGSLLDEDQRTLHSLKNLTSWATAKVFSDPKTTATEEGIKNGLKKAWGLIKSKLTDIVTGTSYGANAFISRSINEGLEETTEEVMMDAVKWMSKGLEYLGIPVSEDGKELDFGRTFGNTMERWGTSFLGGFLGGAVFEFHNQRELYRDPNYLKWRNATPLKQMYQYVAEGNADKLRNMINARGRKGRNGNKNLSASYKTTTNSNGESIHAYGSGTDSDNQNTAMTNALLALVDNAESIYARHNLIWTNDELLKQVLGSNDIRSFMKKNNLSDTDLAIKDITGDKDIQNAIVDAILDLKDDEGNNLGEAIAANVLNDINGIRNEIFDLETKLDIENNRSGEYDTKRPRDKHIKNLTERRDALVKQFESLINGERADNLLTQLLIFFKGNPLENYMGFGSKPDTDTSINNIERYSQLILHIDYQSANDDLKQYIETEYRDFLAKKENLFRNIADLHISLSDSLREDLKTADNQLQDVIVSDKYTRGQTRKTILETVIDLDNEAKILETRMLVAQSNPIDDEYKALATQYQKNRVQAEYFKNLMEKDGDMTLEQWFDYEPVGELESSETLIGKQNSILKFYDDAVKNKALFVDSKFLMSYLSKIDFSGIKTNLHELINKHQSTSEKISDYVDLSHLSDDTLSQIDPILINQIKTGEISVFDAAAQMENGDIFIDELSAKNIFNPNLESRIAEFISVLQGSPVKIKQAYTDLIKYLDNNVDYEMLQKLEEFKSVKNGQDLLHKIFNPSELNDILSFVNEVLLKIENLPVSPVYDWLQKVHNLLFGSNSKIFDIIQNERENISSVGVENYLLGEAAEKDIENAGSVLNIIHGLIEASSPANLNEIINTKRSGYKNPDGSNKEDFTIISDNTKEVLAYELAFLYSQLSTLKSISNRNKGNKIEEEKNIAKVDAAKRFNAIISSKEGTFGHVLHNILKNSGFDFTPYSNNYDISTAKTWRDETYDEFYKLESSFKINLYKHFSNLSEEAQEKLLTEIAEQGSVFTTVLNMETDSFSDDHSVVGDWGLVRYLLANLTTDYSNFNSHYKTVIDQQNDFLPFYGQEFVIRDAYSSFIASKHYNFFLDVLHKKFIDKYNDNEYAKNMLFIRNFLFIDGVPGSGKTSAVASIYAKVLKLELGKDLTIITLTHTNDSDRKKSFGDALGSSEAHRFEHSEFIDKYICSSITQTKKTNNGHSSEFKEKNIINQEGLKAIANINHILIISDEHTFANEEQLKAFSEYANRSSQHVYLLGLGDMFQSGVSDTSDITDTYFQSSIRLTTSFRAENNGKAHNERVIRDLLAVPVKKWSGNRIIKLEEVSKELYNSLESVFSINPLIGYEDKITGQISGDVLSSIDAIPSQIIKLKALTVNDKPAKIAVITDNIATYESYQDDNTVVLTPTQAQGGQWDYVIVDSDITLAPEREKNYQDFKKLYTIMTRARLGTIWNSSKLSPIIRFEQQVGAQRPVSQDMKMNSAARSKYIEFRKHLFDLLGTENTVETAVEVSDSSSSNNKPPVVKSSQKKPSFGNISKNEELYTGLQSNDSKYFRTKYYESSDEDAGEFAKSHGSDRKAYKERQKAINEGLAFDYDSWIDFIDNKNNLIHDSYGYSLENHEKYKQFLYRFNSILMDYLSIKQNRNRGFDFEQKLLDLKNETAFENVIDAIILDQSAKFVIKKKNDSLVVYYEFNVNGKTESVPITALSNNKINESKINSAYVVENTTTSVSTRMIPISSNGERFVNPVEIRPTVNLSNKVLIFKGYDPEYIDKNKQMFTEDAIAWNRRNRGKAFVLLGNLSKKPMDLNFVTWPKEIQKQFTTATDGEQIDYFVDRNSNVYMRLAGIQRVCTTDALSKIMGKIRDAYFAHDSDSDKSVKLYQQICDEVAELTGRTKGTIRLRWYKGKEAAEQAVPNANTAGSIFPQATWRHLQAIAVSVAKDNSIEFNHLNNWLNKKNQNISFNLPNDYKARVTVYSDDEQRVFITSGINANSDSIDITDFYNSLDNTLSLNQKLKQLLNHAIFELSKDEKKFKVDSKSLVDYYKNKFDIQFDNDLSKTITDLIDDAGFDIEFGYISDSNRSFKNSDPAFVFIPTTNRTDDNKNTDSRTIFDAMLEKSNKLRSGRVNMNIYADAHGEGDLSIYGTAEWADGMGFDVVDVLPTNYGFKFGDKTLSQHRYSDDSDIDGMTHHDKTYSLVNGNQFVFKDGPEVNSAWLNMNIPALANGNTYKIIKLTKSKEDGKEVYKVTLSVNNQEETYPIKSTNWLNDYSKESDSFGYFKISKNTKTYKNKPFELIAFNEDKTKCLIQQENAIFEVDIFSENANSIGRTDKEYIYNEDSFAVCIDSARNAFLYYLISDNNDVSLVSKNLQIINNKLNDLFTIPETLGEKLKTIIGDNKLEEQKLQLKKSLDKIKSELNEDSSASKNVISSIFSEIDAIVSSFSIGELSSALLAINKIFEDNAYKIFVKYNLDETGFSTTLTNYNIARNIKLPNNVEIVSITPSENGNFLVSLSNNTTGIYHNNNGEFEEVIPTLNEIQNKEQLLRELLNGFDENLINDFIVAIKSNNEDDKDNIYNTIIGDPLFNFDNLNLLDELLGDFEKLCNV